MAPGNIDNNNVISRSVKEEANLTLSAGMNKMKSTRFVASYGSSSEHTIILIEGDDSSIKEKNQQAEPSKFINIDSLPQEIRNQLNVFDLDGDGAIDSLEILHAVNAQKSMKLQNSLLQKGMMFVCALTAVLVGVVSGMTYFIVQDSKETVVEGQSLLNKKHQPVGANINKAAVPLGAISFMSREAPSKITDIIFQDNGGKDYYRTKESIDVVRKKSVVLKTTSGDIISWDIKVDGGADIHISMADGSSWSRPAYCDECSMTSVVADDAMADAIGKYLEIIGVPTENGRRQLGPMLPDGRGCQISGGR